MIHKLCIALCLAAACAWPARAAIIAPFKAGDTVAPADDDEKRVWGQGDEFDDVLRRSGRLLDDAGLTAYVQQVLDRLFPEFNGRIRVRIVRSPQLNAFALPNGSIYVNQGLLARFENESQLATVLAHEGVHFVNRHGHQSIQNVKSTSAFGTVLSMIGVPAVGLIANVLAASSILGFSRELESEADDQGYPRVVAAGYDPRETPKVFAHLIAELKASEIKEPFFFSTHPKLQERFENFTRLAEKTPVPAELRPDEYAARIAALRMVNLEAELSMGRVRQIIALFGEPSQRRFYPPQADYYLGEAHRRRGEKGDEEIAEQCFARTIEAAPGFAPSYLALGTLHLKRQEYETAEQHLQKYLELAPNPSDRRYAESYIEQARRKGKQP
jgi:beta-barrel assembly-enhancing protease